MRCFPPFSSVISFHEPCLIAPDRVSLICHFVPPVSRAVTSSPALVDQLGLCLSNGVGLMRLRSILTATWRFPTFEILSPFVILRCEAMRKCDSQGEPTGLLTRLNFMCLGGQLMIRFGFPEPERQRLSLQPFGVPSIPSRGAVSIVRLRPGDRSLSHRASPPLPTDPLQGHQLRNHPSVVG